MVLAMVSALMLLLAVVTMVQMAATTVDRMAAATTALMATTTTVDHVTVDLVMKKTLAHLAHKDACGVARRLPHCRASPQAGLFGEYASSTRRGRGGDIEGAAGSLSCRLRELPEICAEVAGSLGPVDL